MEMENLIRAECDMAGTLIFQYGSQCHLHCTKLPSNSFVDASDLHHRTNLSCYCRHSLLMPTHKHTSQFLVGDEGIDAVREKLMLDLKTEANRMKDATQFSARRSQNTIMMSR
ncbi:hypothetical protein JHK85_017403 [Glycine max]|nr:hypothetical protein JHK85_017403 [Glycine max]KAG5047625.1 hypothetical protein JHK86_017031 [Glycine max]